jgi:hypothetical protein
MALPLGQFSPTPKKFSHFSVTFCVTITHPIVISPCPDLSGMKRSGTENTEELNEVNSLSLRG